MHHRRCYHSLVTHSSLVIIGLHHPHSLRHHRHKSHHQGHLHWSPAFVTMIIVIFIAIITIIIMVTVLFIIVILEAFYHFLSPSHNVSCRSSTPTMAVINISILMTASHPKWSSLQLWRHRRSSAPRGSSWNDLLLVPSMAPLCSFPSCSASQKLNKPYT